MSNSFYWTIIFSFVSLLHGATISEKKKSMDSECEMSRNPYTIADFSSGQCDAYIRCERGETNFELCDDGFVYHPRDNLCDMPHRVNCTGREKLQSPKGSGKCPRLNGLYAHSEFCDQYYYCRIGIPLLITCPTGLVYDVKLGVCQYPDEALRLGCMPEEVLGFTCPPMTNSSALIFDDHLRFPKQDDCRYFFKCLKNGYPRLGGCEHGNVFNPITGLCDAPKNVKGCEKYYDEE